MEQKFLKFLRFLNLQPNHLPPLFSNYYTYNN